ncbi:MAG: hypothetical protein IKR25_01815 [Muribaculaceae bacterium]|nr:hypothetical protein [Muribaculaceae bacterium]
MNNHDKWEIIHAIENALSYDCSVDYTRPTRDGQCGYFDISIDEDDDDWDWEIAEGELQRVCDEHDLWFDDACDEDFCLCASWDSYD